MPAEGWFRRKTFKPQTPAARHAAAVPDGVATKCARCGEIIFTLDFERAFKVCPLCDFHHKLTARERIAWTLDNGDFEPLWDDLRSTDPLHFPDYAAKLAKGEMQTGDHDGISVGLARIGGVGVVFGVADFGFMGASMGSVAGEKITRALEEGIARACPVVLFTASGGARMQEGLLSLMQMAKTAAAAQKLAQAGRPYLVVLTDPTMAGVAASYATLGDILLAEPRSDHWLCGRARRGAGRSSEAAGRLSNRGMAARARAD